LAVQAAYAEYPIEVERLNAEGRHLQALVVLEKIPVRVRTAQTLIAAGKSAWALGLVNHAANFFQDALKFPEQTISQEDRARVNLMRGVIEYQEHRLDTAVLYAEESLKSATEIPGLLNAVHLLLGDIATAKNDYQVAQRHYEQALQDVAPSEKGEVEYRLGNALASQHQHEAAIAAYQRVPVDSVKAPEAIRSIAKLEFDAGKYEDVKFWLTKGRVDYPDKFLDSWVDYVLVESALKLHDIEAADEVAVRARASFPPSEGWMVLLEGTLEKAKWDDSRRENNKEKLSVEVSHE
jgi:tetratricopeptide (TPR) repeat protein